MKTKLILAFFVIGLSTCSFAQEIVNGVEIKTEHLEAIVYESQAQKDEQCQARIDALKLEMSKEGNSAEYNIHLAEVIWRFQHAIVAIKQ